MELHVLYSRLLKLKEQAIPGMEDLKLSDEEIGPFCEFLSELKQTEEGLEMVFGEGKAITLLSAIKELESLVKLIPDAIVFRRYNESVVPLKRVYEDVPVFIMECDIPYEEE